MSLFEMLKIVVLDALGVKDAPKVRSAYQPRRTEDAFDDEVAAPRFDPHFHREAELPAMDRAGHVVGDRDYIGIAGDHFI